MTIQRHWFGGVAFIAIFAILLLFRLGVHEKLASKTSDLSLQIQSVVPSGETWMTILQQGRKIGYAQRKYETTDNGFRFSEYLFMMIRTMGVVQPLTVTTEADLKADRSIDRFRFALRSNLFHFKVRGVVSGDKLTLWIEASGDERRTTVRLEAPPYLGGGILESAGVLELATGEEKTVTVFDPASMGQRPLRITMLGEEKISVMDRSYSARKISLDFMGMKQIAWIDAQGAVLREEGILGIVLERVSKQSALAEMGEGFGTDLTELASIPSTRPIQNPSELNIITLRLSGISAFSEKADGEAFLAENHGARETSLFLDGGRQTYRDGVITIRLESALKSPVTGRSPVDAPEILLKPTPFIQSDHPKIRTQLAQIVAPDAPENEKAKRLVSWVHKNLEKRPVLSIPNALETLEKRTGDCNEHAVLLAALARAAGIPADVEVGLVYLDGRFFYHAWNVLYLRQWGGWVTADAVFGQMPADVTHIRFVRGAIDRQLDLIGLIGKIDIEVLEAGS